MGRKIVYSALQPTGLLTIGNYIGAIKNMIKLQEEYECYYSVADLHSITVDVNPDKLRDNCYNLFAFFLAFGLEKSTVFVQSHIPEHSQLTWVLNCHTQMGEARRMTQFKDKSAKQPANVNVGLFDYPVLMAADILLYGAHHVPIGKDQKQHLELTKVIAERFNSKYGNTLEIPQAIFPKFGAKVASLLDPTQKMSKSEDAIGTVFISDSNEEIIRKFKRAVTDSERVIRYDAVNKAGISNLLTIYSAFDGRSITELEKDCEGINYGVFKTRVADAVIEGLRPFRREYERIRPQKDYLDEVMKKNNEIARKSAQETMKKVYQRIGLITL